MSAESPLPQAGALLVGNDAMNMLLDIYLDGFASGAASGAATILGTTSMPPETAAKVSDEISDQLIAAIHADPLTVEAIRREIGERLTGIDSGAKSFTLPIPETDR